MRVALLVMALASAGALATPPEDAPLEDVGDRLRFGFSGGLGAIIPLKTALVEGEVRFGYQATNTFGAFLIGGANWGFGSGTYLVFVGGIVEFVPADFFYIGGGPVFGYGRASAFNLAGPFDEGPATITEPDSAGFSSTFKPGLDLRFGLNTSTGRPPTFRRLGFTVGFDLKMFFHTDLKMGWPQLGRAVVNTTQSIVTFAPMVVIGFDSR